VTLTKWTTGIFLQIKTLRAQKEGLVITLEQKFDVIEQHEHGHSNFEIGQDVGMPDSVARNIMKHSGEIKFGCVC
jgi:hypothetical protein